MLDYIPKDWKKNLQDEIKKDYFQYIQNFLQSEKTTGKIIYPEEKDIFKALPMISSWLWEPFALGRTMSIASQ